MGRYEPTAHSENIISSIKLPGVETPYQIHDANAIHSAEELGLGSALVFKGTKKTDAEILAIADAHIGDVWLSTGTNAEYVCTKEISEADATAWEKLGDVHDAASSKHTHAVTVTGTNAASTVTGSVTVPTVSKTQKYLTATAGGITVTPSTDSVLGANTTFNVSGGTATTTKIKATASGTAVAGNGTAAAITDLGTPSTSGALGTGATFKVSGGGATTSKMVTDKASKVTVTNKNIPNVIENTSVRASHLKNSGSKTAGTAASWSASVTNGVLSFAWTANTPTAVTLPTFDEVTATNTTLGTAISASSVSASDVTVATGTLSDQGTGSAVATGMNAITVAVDNADTVTAITGLGTPTTANVLTDVKVTAQPTIKIASGTTGDVSVVTGVSAIEVAPAANDNVTALTGVSASTPTITLTNNDTNVTGSVPVVSGVTIGSTSASLQNGSAAAQKWTQNTGSTGQPQ